MMLQLPIWRYPAVVIFSLGLHGILLLIIFSEYRRNPPPSQIEWFDLREMTLTTLEIQEKSQSASAISAVPKKKHVAKKRRRTFRDDHPELFQVAGDTQLLTHNSHCVFYSKGQVHSAYFI